MTAGLVVALFLLTAVAARAAARTRRRAAVIRRVTGAVRPPASRGRVSLTTIGEPPARLVREIEELDLRADASRLWRGWCGALGVAAVLGAALIGLVFGAILVGLVAAVPVVGVVVLRSRAEGAYDDTLAVALDAAARSVRSGGSLPQAVAEASTSVRGAVAADLARVVAAVGRGRTFADALAGWRVDRDRPSVRLAVGALALAAQTGGPPARVIEDVASAVRVRQQVAREAHALAAQARLSALVVGVAPLAFMLVTSVTDARNSHMLFGTPIGITCVVTGLALDGIGALWMHRMSAAVAG